MKKLFTIAFLLITLALSACQSGENALPLASPGALHIPEPTTAPDTPNEISFEEPTANIVAAGSFWEDWWDASGIFENQAGPSVFVQSQGEPAGVGMSFTPLLSSSGFASIDDVKTYLLQFYTESALADIDLPFIELDGVLHFSDARIGTARFDWSRVNFEQISDNTIRANVLFGYFALEPGDYVDLIFHMINGRINRIEGGNLMTALLDIWDDFEAVAWRAFEATHGDIALFIDRAEHVGLESFDWLYQLDHTALWQPSGYGEELVIWATGPLYSPALIHFSNDWDEDANEFVYILLEIFGMQNTMQLGEALHISGFSSLGTMPHSGISFYDAQGNRHFFAIHHDNSDSPHWYMMWDITNQMQISGF